MAAGGKAYGTRPSHGRLSASTAQAWGSGTGDTNLASLLLNLITRGLFEVGATCCTLPGRTLEGETTLTWPSLDSLSATTFSWPVMCRALRVTYLLVHQVRILHRRAHRGPDFIPLSLFIRNHCGVVCGYKNCFFRQRCWTLLGSRTLLLVPCNLCVACFLEGTRFSLRCDRLSVQPSFDASVNNCRVCLVGVMVDLGAHCFPPVPF